MHIRRGASKATYSDVEHTFDTFSEQAERLFAGDQTIEVLSEQFSEARQVFKYSSVAFANRTVFVNGDSQSDINAALDRTNAKQNPWRVAYMLEERDDDWWDVRDKRGVGFTAMMSFLGLEVALEAEAWVCTLASNWCAVIDHL